MNTMKRRIDLYKMTIIRESGEVVTTLSVLYGETILSVLQREGLEMPGICGINGVCGKCMVRVLGGEIIPSMVDTQMFTREEIDLGYRLACMAKPTEDCIVELLFVDDELKRIEKEKADMTHKNVHNSKKPVKNYAVAIDLGTTTIGMQLVDTDKQRILHTQGALNPQRKYGADVISRIMAANDGKEEEMRELVIDVIRENLEKIAAKEGVSPGELQKVYLAGNTTMVHLLMGFSCKTLGSFPFKPVSLQRQQFIAKGCYYLPIVVLPGISAFVGGDIVAGLYETGFGEVDEINMLIDLGTNGEIAVGNREKIFCTATAAGPAFEGSFGVNLMGSDMIAIVADLLGKGIIDHTGLLREPYFEEGYEIQGELLKQKNIRDLQMAKAAICVGIDTLVREYGITYEDIAHVYLAGGFGRFLNVDKAIAIGLFPQVLNNKIVSVGNTSLLGTIRYACSEEKSAEVIASIRSVCKEYNLALQKDFGEDYVKALSFPERF